LSVFRDRQADDGGEDRVVDAVTLEGYYTTRCSYAQSAPLATASALPLTRRVCPLCRV